MKPTLLLLAAGRGEGAAHHAVGKRHAGCLRHGGSAGGACLQCKKRTAGGMAAERRGPNAVAAGPHAHGPTRPVAVARRCEYCLQHAP